jgi:hypothetical protein
VLGVNPPQGAVLSFFDEGDEPRTAIGVPPPRRPSSRPSQARHAPLDDRTLFARRAGAIGTVLVVIILVVVGARAYISSQQTQALKNYNSQVTNLVDEQQTQVATPFFTTLNGAAGVSGNSEITLQTTLEEDAVTAQQEASQAAAWSVPGPMVGAQQNLLLVLDLRYEALNNVQQDIDAALSPTGGQAAENTALEEIAGAMQMLNASDVIYSVRVQPLIEQALEHDNIQVASLSSDGVPLSGESVIGSSFLQSESWVLTSFVAGKLLGSTPADLGGPALVGTSGDKLTGISVNGSALSANGINQLQYTKGMVFTLTFENDGQNQEIDTGTKLVLSSATFSAITAAGEVAKTEPGQTYSSALAFTQGLPLNVPLELKGTVEKVPGEKDTSNNSLTFIVEFT